MSLYMKEKIKEEQVNAEKARKDAFYEEIFRVHPDAQEIIRKKEFRSWFAQEYNGLPLRAIFRPDDLQGNPQTSEQAISCLTRFKQLRTPKAPH